MKWYNYLFINDAVKPSHNFASYTIEDRIEARIVNVWRIMRAFEACGRMSITNTRNVGDQYTLKASLSSQYVAPVLWIRHRNCYCMTLNYRDVRASRYKLWPSRNDNEINRRCQCAVKRAVSEAEWRQNGIRICVYGGEASSDKEPSTALMCHWESSDCWGN